MNGRRNTSVSADRPAEAVGRQDHLTFKGNVAQGRHGWLRLTPAYSLQVVRRMLAETERSELVLDPFSGTGTTPLVCASMGVRCHAVDINPFLVWLGNLKLLPSHVRLQSDVTTAARQIARSLKGRRRRSAWVPDLHAIEKWWDAETVASLALLYEQVRELRQRDGVLVADLLKVAFCRVVIQTANVSFGHQSMSFKKRPRQQLNLLEPASPLQEIRRMFLAAAEDVAASLSLDEPRAGARVHSGDARQLAEALPSIRYTRVVTSPPYPNRMSYIRELRPYMYWLGYLANGRDAGELDWKAIGGTWGCATSLLNTWSPRRGESVPSEHLNEAVAAITEKHELLGRYVHKYFLDMKRHIESLRTVLAPGARCHYVVGNSKFYDTLVRVEQIYAELFEWAGFRSVEIATLRKRTSKRELYEFVVSGSMPRS